MIYKSILKTISILLIFTLNGCYSFTGSSLDGRYKTINIRTFPNYAPLQNPLLSQQFTEDLRSRFAQRSRMDVTNAEDANIVLSGEITDYNINPINVVSGDKAAQNRLTITVKVDYVNSIEEDKSFTKSYSQYEDFDASQNITVVENGLVEEINKKLIDLIFNDIVANW